MNLKIKTNFDRQYSCNICRILQDHTDSSGMHSQALDSLKQKLVEVEDSLRREKEAYKQAQVELFPPY